MSKPDTSTPLRDAAFYVKADMKALQFLLAKLEKNMTNPNWENEKRLLLRCSATLGKSVKAFQNALND